MSQHPSMSSTAVPREEFERRYAIYGEAGQLGTDLAAIWAKAAPLIRETCYAEREQIQAEMQRADLGDGLGALAQGTPADLDVRAHTDRTLLDLFMRPVNAEWFRYAALLDDNRFDLNWPISVSCRVVSRTVGAAIRAISSAFSEDPLFVRMATDRLCTLLAIKLDLMMMRFSTRALAEQREIRAMQGASFREAVASLLGDALTESKSLRQRTADASGSARGMLGKTSEVAAAAEQSAIAMREAAQTAAGLIRAIEDARNEVETAAGVATRAGEESKRAVEVSTALSEHAHAIESILGLIRDIAGQTNLLALNATIEAARAGDAGRGFAVVAQEVKSLANQTARATDDIAAKIGAIQVATRQTVEANGSIRVTIRDVQTSAERIRTAMETQAQTVTMITAAVDETALAADAMSGTIAAIRSGTENLAGNIDDLDIGFRDVDGKLATLESNAIEFIAGLG